MAAVLLLCLILASCRIESTCDLDPGGACYCDAEGRPDLVTGTVTHVDLCVSQGMQFEDVDLSGSTVYVVLGSRLDSSESLVPLSEPVTFTRATLDSTNILNGLALSSSFVDVSGTDTSFSEPPRELQRAVLNRPHIHGIGSPIRWDDVEIVGGAMHELSFVHSGIGFRGYSVAFIDCDMTEFFAGDTRFNRTSFQGSSLESAAFSASHLRLVDFQGANLAMAVFRSCVFEHVDFSHADLTGAKFTDVDLTLTTGWDTAVGVDPGSFLRVVCPDGSTSSQTPACGLMRE